MKKYIFLGAAMLLLTAACSNDENRNGQEKPTQAVQFSFTNEDFGADEALSRATSAAETKLQIVELGDCEAEITVENESMPKATRGTTTPATGHYTIRAYQGSALKGEISGTFDGTKFTPDAASAKDIQLSHGTYDFVAFNDDVTISGNGLTIARDKVATARIGTTTETINQDPKQKVGFTMKHVGARIRTQFVCQKDLPENITATLESTATNVIPTSVTYNPVTKGYNATHGVMAPETNNSSASTETKYFASYFGKNYSYTSTSDYHYFLPTTEGGKLKLTFAAGTVFWKPITGTIPQLNTALSMQPNKSYLVKIKLKPQFTYLMSDGSTGFFRETISGGGTKTPVGVVVSKDQHLAIALHDAASSTVPWSNTGIAHNNTTTTNPNLTAHFSDMGGYDYTWTTTYSLDGIIRANDAAKYPSFYYAAHYNPGISLSGTLAGKQWYLPATGELNCVLKTLYFIDPGALSSAAFLSVIRCYGALAETAFTQVGGTNLNPYAAYHTCGELDTEYTIAINIANYAILYNKLSRGGHHGMPRSFIKY